MDRIFISYRRDDGGGYAGNLYRDLRREFGRQVFQDVESSLPGDSYRDQIEAALARCRVVVVVIGPDWLRRDEEGHCRFDDPEDLLRFEIATALRRPGLAVVPVQVGGAGVPRRAELPQELQPLLDRTTYRLDEGPQRDAQVRFLLRAIARRLDAQAALPAALAAVLAVAAVAWPARQALGALNDRWTDPGLNDAPLTLVRLGVLHAAEWVLLAAFAAGFARLMARGVRGARRAFALGALTGALGGLAGGALEMWLRAHDQASNGLIAGATLTAVVAAPAGLAGRRSFAAVAAAGVGALVAGALVRHQHDGPAYYWPVAGTIVAVAALRLAAFRRPRGRRRPAVSPRPGEAAAPG